MEELFDLLADLGNRAAEAIGDRLVGEPVGQVGEELTVLWGKQMRAAVEHPITPLAVASRVNATSDVSLAKWLLLLYRAVHILSIHSQLG
jgi:hypothetical protein